MVKALKFFIGGILLFSTEQAVSCTCLEDLGCEIADRVLVIGRIEKVFKGDGSIAKPGTILKPESKDGNDVLYMGDFYTFFTVLNSDDTTLIGKIIKLKARGGGGASCGTGLYYGFGHFELYTLKRESDTLSAEITSCTTKKYFSEKATLDSHFAQRLAVKEKCKKENLIGYWRFVKYETPSIDDHAFSDKPGDLILREDMTFTEPDSPSDTSIDGTWTFKGADGKLLLHYSDHDVHNMVITGSIVTGSISRMEANKLWLMQPSGLAYYEKGRPVEFVQVAMLRNSEEKRDSLIETWQVLSKEKLEPLILAGDSFNSRIFITVKILPSGKVSEVEVVRGVKEAEQYYDAFIEEIGKAMFPKIKSNSVQGFQAYRITFPLDFQKAR